MDIAAIARIGIGMFAAASVVLAHAQDYPSRPVRMLVPLAAGGGMDTVARALALRLSERMGQNFIVDNRPGAGGSVALETAAMAAPDGHTVMVISATSVTHPMLYKARYDVLRDFAPVTQLTAQGYVAVVHPSLPVRSVAELIQHLRAHPGKLNFASSGIGSLIHLTGELFKVATGTQMTHVPYKGMAAAYTDMIAGQVEIGFPTIISSQPHIRGGRLRGLAVTGPVRAPALPELPTLREAGVSGVVVTNWYGLLAPAGTPRAVVERLSREATAAIRLPETAKRLVADGSEAVGTTPEQFAAHIAAERDQWIKVIREAGIKGT